MGGLRIYQYSEKNPYIGSPNVISLNLSGRSTFLNLITEAEANNVFDEGTVMYCSYCMFSILLKQHFLKVLEKIKEYLQNVSDLPKLRSIENMISKVKKWNDDLVVISDDFYDNPEHKINYQFELISKNKNEKYLIIEDYNYVVEDYININIKKIKANITYPIKVNVSDEVISEIENTKLVDAKYLKLWTVAHSLSKLGNKLFSFDIFKDVFNFLSCEEKEDVLKFMKNYNKKLYLKILTQI